MAVQFTHGYALLIGVGQTDYANWLLPVTVKDAEALRSILVDPNLCAYLDDAHHIRFLYDTEATRTRIFDDLTRAEAQIAEIVA